MKPLDWTKIQEMAKREARLETKLGSPFHIIAVTETNLTVRVKSGREHQLYRYNLEEAVELLNKGIVIRGPKDYRERVADDRPTYAWAILKALGHIQ